MKKKIDPIEKSIPEQEWTKYNRESGKKTLYFVGVMITVTTILTICLLLIMFTK